MKQQTAVEWLVNELKPHIKSDWPLFRSIRNKIEQAKHMEKEQILKSHIDGFDHIVVDFKKQEFAEQYYNEIFKK